MSKPLIMILNGPPGCGKDTIANAWANKREHTLFKHVHAFKEPMWRIAAETLGMGYFDFLDKYNDREWKEKPRDEWGGQSVRDLMIRISETYIKPFFGEEYFGKIAAANLRGLSSVGDIPVVHIFSDGGFKTEIEVLEKEFDVQVVNVFRMGCDFSGDSRSYIGCSRGAIRLENNGTVDEAVDLLQRIVNDTRERIRTEQA